MPSRRSPIRSSCSASSNSWLQRQGRSRVRRGAGCSGSAPAECGVVAPAETARWAARWVTPWDRRPPRAGRPPDLKARSTDRAASLAAYAFSNQKTQVKWRVRPHMNSRAKPLARFTPNNRSRERLFGRRARKEPFRSSTRGPTHQKRCISWFENAYARVFATSGDARGVPCSGIRCRRARGGASGGARGGHAPRATRGGWRGSGARQDRGARPAGSARTPTDRSRRGLASQTAGAIGNER